MSNLWINLRLWYWHLQIGPDRPWPSITFNSWRWKHSKRGIDVRILDLSAGARHIWFDKSHRDTVYVDRRPEVNPTVVADSRALPPEIGMAFGLVVFDPPHVNFGARGNMAKRYGHHTTAEIRDVISGTAKEAHRVSMDDALMAFKWNDHDQPLAKVLALMAEWWEPLFGHKTTIRSKHSCSTQWVMLRRRA